PLLSRPRSNFAKARSLARFQNVTGMSRACVLKKIPWVPLNDLPPSRARTGPMNIATRRLHVLCLSACLTSLVAEAATSMTPIALTGWNRDVIVESTAVGPPFTAYAAPMNSGEANAFYQTGLPTYAWGLPPSGAFVSMIGDSTIFQFQPYTANNALVLSPDTGLTGGTLTLATPATYAKIAILANAGNGTNATGSLTLNFADGTSFVTTYFAPDWFNISTNVAWFGFARINLNTGSDEGGTQNPRY